MIINDSVVAYLRTLQNLPLASHLFPHLAGGGCGCGDRQGTWLVANGNDYSKLDYPKLNCPINMPGFTNYTPSKPDEAVSPITRKYYIENVSFEDLNNIPVTLPEMPDAMKKAMEEREAKIMEQNKLNSQPLQ